MKDALYLPHDLNARNDLKIAKLRAEFGVEGYGIFWVLIEIMAENNAKISFSDIPGIAFSNGIPEEKLRLVIDFCLGNHIRLFRKRKSSFTNRRVIAHEQQRRTYILAGKQGAAKRWGKPHEDSPPIGGGNSPPNAKERNKEIKTARACASNSNTNQNIDSIIEERLGKIATKDMIKAVMNSLPRTDWWRIDKFLQKRYPGGGNGYELACKELEGVAA